MAEEFMLDGKHVLIVYDDLKQASACNELSLLLRRLRSKLTLVTYSTYSRLLERAKVKRNLQNGSITALHSLKRKRAISAYIPTNVISITDGQISYNLTYSTQVYVCNQRWFISITCRWFCSIKAMKK